MQPWSLMRRRSKSSLMRHVSQLRIPKLNFASRWEKCLNFTNKKRNRWFQHWRQRFWKTKGRRKNWVRNYSRKKYWVIQNIRRQFWKWLVKQSGHWRPFWQHFWRRKNVRTQKRFEVDKCWRLERKDLTEIPKSK